MGNPLIRRVAAGDLYALELLFTTYKTKVFRLALSILKDRQLAEDITQETFIKIQQNASYYQRDLSEAAWIITIARNLSLDLLKKRRQECIDDSELRNLHTEFQLQDNMRFFEIIEDLPDIDKEIITLHIVAGLKHRETAQILQRSTHAVKKRYERALTKLKTQMTTEEKEEMAYG